MQAPLVRIGTRGSPLALAQAREVQERLQAAHGKDSLRFQVSIYKTTGDRIQDRLLSEVGGKGLFTKELEEALLAKEIDIAVHSMKDMPTVLPPGLGICCVLPREDVRDAFVSHTAKSFDDLPQGAVVATASLRREAQVRRMRPDITVVPLRGNVETRLRKLHEGLAEATLLACAGLRRLGLEAHIASALPPDKMLPACAQGAIGIEARMEDSDLLALLAPVNHPASALAVNIERAFLGRLDGSCRTPIAGLAELHGDALYFRGIILTPDGRQAHATERRGNASDGVRLAVDAAEELLAAAGPDFLRTRP